MYYYNIFLIKKIRACKIDSEWVLGRCGWCGGAFEDVDKERNSWKDDERNSEKEK